jgi:nitroreductase
VEAFEALLGRRSIRRFAGREVSEPELKRILEAGMAAPSAGNQQPWRFVVLSEPRVKADIAALSPHAAALAEAPLGIVVCGDLDAEKHAGYWIQDCSAAVENMLLAAHAIGLGAVWLGFYPREERWRGAQRVLGIPERVVPLAVLALGPPAEQKGPANRYEDSFIHFNRW